MSVTINTYVSRAQARSEATHLLTVLTFVDSLSNYQQANVSYITSQEGMNVCFPDKVGQRSPTLKLAEQMIGAGYGVLAVNIHQCKYPETLRISKNENSFEGTWFDPELDLGYFVTTLHDSDHLAVKFKLDDLRDGKYLLLEHQINGYPANGLVYTSDKVPLNTKNFAPGQDKKYIPGSGWDALRNSFRQMRYVCYYTPSDGYVHLAFPYTFDLPETWDSNRVVLEYDLPFQDVYKNAVMHKNRVMDITSRYNSDIADIKVEFFYDSFVYRVNIYKLYNGDNVSFTETYYDKDYATLIQRINSMSSLIWINTYTNDIPVGSYYLKQCKQSEPVTYDTYLEFLDSIEDLVAEGYLFRANIIYEPELEITREQQLVLQKKLDKAFSNNGNMLIKFCTYLEDSPSDLNCYFPDKHYLINKASFPAKRLGLFMLIDGANRKSIYGVSEETDKEETFPIYVNELKLNFLQLTMDRLKVFYHNNMYDIRDLLLVSSFNAILNHTSQEKTRELMYAIIELINNRFREQLGYNPKISLTGFSRYEDTVKVSIRYDTSDMRQVSTLDLYLDIND